MKECDVLIIGGGAAGMTAAITLSREAPDLQLILAEREEALGGILRQCLHEGFGESNQTGPVYSDFLKKRLKETRTEILTGTDISELCKDGTDYLAAARNAGENEWIRCRHIILAAGCYERASGNLMIGGTRPDSIYTAGEMQRMLNLEGYEPGEKNVVMIGSGDIGLIIARRLILHGCRIQRIVEIQRKCPAMERNKTGCLYPYQLPLQLESQVICIHGEETVTAVTIENTKTHEVETVPCDLLITAAGLIPDQSLMEFFGSDEHITFVGNCERVFPSVEGIVHSVSGKCRKLAKILTQ